MLLSDLHPRHTRLGLGLPGRPVSIVSRWEWEVR